MRLFAILLVLSAFVTLEIQAASPAKDNQKNKTQQAPKKKPLPNKNQIIARLRKETPFVQTKVGDTVSCLLLSNVTITGKIYRIQPNAVWIDDGVAKLRQNREMMSMEARAKFWKEDYNSYLAEQADEEIRQRSTGKFKGNVHSVADKKDPRFKRPKMNPGNKLKKKK